MARAEIFRRTSCFRACATGWFARLRFAAIGWLTIGVAAATQAGTIRDDRPASSYLALGDSIRYASVGLVTELTATGSLLSSGTLIAPNVVLTAAHAIDRATGIRFQVGGASYSASRWVTNPNWTGNLAAGFDLGLFLLDRPVANVAPAKRYDGGGELGAIATFVGFGRTGSGITGDTRYDGLKRAGTNFFDDFYRDGKANPRILVSDFDNPRSALDNAVGSAAPTTLEFLSARGDSGGGVFLDTPFGPRLAGVISFGYANDGRNNADYGDLMGTIRLSAFNSWIDQTLRSFPSTSSFAGAGGGRLVGNSLEVGSVPEPASISLAIASFVGLVIVVWRRRSQPRLAVARESALSARSPVL